MLTTRGILLYILALWNKDYFRTIGIKKKNRKTKIGIVQTMVPHCLLRRQLRTFSYKFYNIEYTYVYLSVKEGEQFSIS